MNNFLTRLKQFLLRNYTHLYGLFHPIEDKILFISFGGKQYSDNPRAISEKMHDLFPEYKLVWGLRDVSNEYGILPDYINVVSSGHFPFYQELATSRFFVTNEAMEPNLYKRQGQVFVQTWHGDRGFKKILYEYWEDKQQKRPIKIIDNEVTDFFVTGSSYGENRARDAFHYYGELYGVGMPRNDRLINPSEGYIMKVKDRLGINSQSKIILYAPTFRGTGREKQKIEFDIEKVIEHLKAHDDNWICLVRAHSISGGIELSDSMKSYCIDVTKYPDMADILLVSDILITDYSSSSGDFILKNKPVILLYYDLEEYNKKHRSFRISPEEAGYMCVRNDDELVNLIDNLTDEQIKKECDSVKKFFGIKETGCASELVCQKMIGGDCPKTDVTS